MHCVRYIAYSSSKVFFAWTPYSFSTESSSFIASLKMKCAQCSMTNVYWTRCIERKHWFLLNGIVSSKIVKNDEHSLTKHHRSKSISSSFLFIAQIGWISLLLWITDIKSYRNKKLLLVVQFSHIFHSHPLRMCTKKHSAQILLWWWYSK